MKLVATLAAAVAVLMAVAPSAAGEIGHVYFTGKDRAAPHALGLASIDGRYPRLETELNIPAGAMGPIPVHAFAVPSHYDLGEAAVPLDYVGRDAKGRATHDAKGRPAWDNGSARMAW